MSVGPIEEELKQAAAIDTSSGGGSMSDDAFARTAPTTVPFARDIENGYRPSTQAPAPIRDVRRQDIPGAKTRPAFQPRPSALGTGGLEPSGRREYPFGESAYPLAEQDERSTSERARAAGPKRLKGQRALEERATPLFGRNTRDMNEEEVALAYQVFQGRKMTSALDELNEKDSRDLTPSSRFTETDPRRHRTYSPALTEQAARVEGSIPEAYSEDEENWVAPGGPNSRDWANGYRPAAQAPAPIREVDRAAFPDKDARPESDPRPSENPHGDLEPSGRRDYPMGENFVPIAEQDAARTSERFRAARYNRTKAERERRAGLQPEDRAREDADKQIRDEDKAAMRKATRPFRQVQSADTGQANLSGAGYVGQKRFAMFENLGAQRQQILDTIAAKQAKIDRTGFRLGNIGNWFSGLFRNRGRRRDIAAARRQLAGLDQQAAERGIADFGEDTGSALRQQAELETRLPKTGGESRTFREATGKTQQSYAYGSGNAFYGERPLLQHIGMAAAQSLGNRAQPDGDFAPGSLVSSQLDELVNQPDRLGRVNPETVKKWGTPAASAGSVIPEASVDEEDADEIAERTAADGAARARRQLITDPLPRAAARNSGAIAESAEQLDTAASRRPASVGGSVGAARGKLATWEKLERRFDDADLEFAIQYGRRNLIGARENLPATAVPQDTSALRNQAIYEQSPEQFGFHSPLLPDGADPRRRNSAEVPNTSGAPLVADNDDVRTAQDSLGDRLRGREEGTGLIEGGRDFLGNASLGGYRSSIGGYRDALANNPFESDFIPGGRTNPQGPKYKSSAEIFARANERKGAPANPLLTGQLLFGVVSTNAPKPQKPTAPAKKVPAPAPQPGAAKLAEFNARPDGLAPSAGRSAATAKKVAFAQGSVQKASGSSWFKPWTWGAKKTAWKAPQGEEPQIPGELQPPVAQPSRRLPEAPKQTVSPEQRAKSRPDLEEEKIDAEVLESAKQAGIDGGTGQDIATRTGQPTQNATPTAMAPRPVKFGPLTRRQDFKKNVWSGYDRTRHLLPGETPRARHDLGPGGRDARFPVHEDPKFDPSPEYVQQLEQELQDRPAEPREMIQPQKPRPVAAPMMAAAGLTPLVAEKPTAADAGGYESGSADNLRIMFERLGMNKRGR